MRTTKFTVDPEKVAKLPNVEELFVKYHGERGTLSRTEFEAKAKAWYYGEILRERRKELHITQQELATQIGRERAYISRIEQGETDIQLSTFIRIAEALGIDLALNVRLA